MKKMRVNLSKNEFLIIKTLLEKEKEKEMHNNDVLDLDKFTASAIDYLLENKFKEFILPTHSNMGG